MHRKWNVCWVTSYSNELKKKKYVDRITERRPRLRARIDRTDTAVKVIAKLQRDLSARVSSIPGLPSRFSIIGFSKKKSRSFFSPATSWEYGFGNNSFGNIHKTTPRSSILQSFVYSTGFSYMEIHDFTNTSRVNAFFIFPIFMSFFSKFLDLYWR